MPDSYSYLDLQNTINNLIAHFGLDRTVELLESHVQSDLNARKEERLVFIFEWLVGKVAHAYLIQPLRLINSPKRTSDLSEARSILFHLLNQVVGYSKRQVGDLAGRRPWSTIHYLVGRCEERLTMPQQNQHFCEKYNRLKTELLNFIAKQ